MKIKIRDKNKEIESCGNFILRRHSNPAASDTISISRKQKVRENKKIECMGDGSEQMNFLPLPVFRKKILPA